MSGIDALQSVQFITTEGKRFAVIDGDDWEALIEWLETLEDAQAVQTALASLQAADGDRTKADGYVGMRWRGSLNEPLYCLCCTAGLE